MKIYREDSLSNFEFWSGAKNRASVLTDDDFDAIETILDDLYPDGMSETEINDLFWFEGDTIAQWLGFDDFEALERDHNDEDDEDDEDEE